MKQGSLIFMLLYLSLIATAQPTLEPGWPVQTGFSVSQSPVVGQLDDDDVLEFAIASQDGYLYVFNHDGTLVNGWPQYMGTALWPDPYANICSSPAVYDVNDDGLNEIIVGCFDGYMYVFSREGNLLPGWPFQSGFTVFSTPALGDIDDDGEMEIIYGDNSGGIYALNVDGSVCTGFPYPTPYVVRSSPAVGDLDHDGIDEIVITADNNDYHLYAIDGDGSDLPGFPIQFANAIGSNSSPALADVDVDGDLEIVVGDRSGYLHVMHHDGQYLPNWPIDAGYSLQSCPTVVNLDYDPELEIIVGMNDSQVIIYEADGSYFPGWPQPTAYTVISSASVGDIDGDDELEVVVGCNTGEVYGWNLDGSAVPGFPLTDPTYTVYSSPLLEDFDYDGHLEMVMGCNDTWIYCWDLGANTYNPDLLPWPQFRLDARNTATLIIEPQVEFIMYGLNPPIVIPPMGGNFEFFLSLMSSDTYTLNFDAWVMVTMPDSTLYGPVLGPVDIVMPEGQTIERYRIQEVPGSAPAGEYTYTGYVGYYPDYIWDEQSFNFTKSMTDSGDGWVSQWLNTGDPLEIQADPAPPADFTLLENYPNPFNPVTTIRFSLPEGCRVRLELFDISGRSQGSPLQGWREAGVHEVTFNASGLASGVYVYRLKAGDFSASGKMVLMK